MHSNGHDLPAGYKVSAQIVYTGQVFALERELGLEQALIVALAIWNGADRFVDRIQGSLEQAGCTFDQLLGQEKPRVEQVDPETGHGPQVSFPKFRFWDAQGVPLVARARVNVCKGHSNSKVWFRVARENEFEAHDPSEALAFFEQASSIGRDVVTNLGDEYRKVLKESVRAGQFSPTVHFGVSAADSRSGALAEFMDSLTQAPVDAPLVISSVKLAESPDLAADVRVLQEFSGLQGDLRSMHRKDGALLRRPVDLWDVRHGSASGLYLGQLSNIGLSFMGLCAAGNLAPDRSASRPTTRRVVGKAAAWL